MKGTFSGGTAASARATFAAVAKDLSLVSMVQDPFVLTPGFDGPKQPRGNKPLLDEDMGQWTAPFVMATINTRNVHRSNLLMNFPYGKDFVYDEMILTGAGEQGEAKAKKVVAAVNAERMGASGGAEAGRGALEGGAARTACTTCCSSPSRPTAARFAPRSRATAIPAMARPRR